MQEEAQAATRRTPRKWGKRLRYFLLLDPRLRPFARIWFQFPSGECSD